MNCIIIPDKEMNSYITKLNPNFVFVWCEQYAELVDFVNGERIPARYTYETIIPHFIAAYGNDEAKKTISDALFERHNLLEVAQIYHDTSRKVYIITY